MLDEAKTEVKYNGDWLAPLTFAEVVQLASNFTVQQFLGHETYKRRIEEGRPLYLHEFIYALMQGYDAYHLKTDVQIGGTEQLFNILAGRTVQSATAKSRWSPSACPSSRAPTASCACRSRPATTSAWTSRRAKCTARSCRSPTS